MHVPNAQRRRYSPFLASLCIFWSIGCGGASGTIGTNPISVYLPISNVVVVPGSMAVSVPIEINSSSETALVNVAGLPMGVQATYAASDTNPSGTLTFAASSAASAGTYMTSVTVMSSGQTASTGFTLIVKSS